MKRSKVVSRCALAALLVSLFCGFAIAYEGFDDPGISPIKTKTLLNLSPATRGYLSLDPQANTATLSPNTGQQNSETFWELRPFGRYRGYRAHLVIQRGNNPFNQSYLEIDEKTGQLRMGSSKDAPVAKWLVRYAGRANGYDAFYVQNLGRSEGGFDMQFIVADAQSGEIRLDPKPVAGAHWRVRPAPDLPSELILSGTSK